MSVQIVQIPASVFNPVYLPFLKNDSSYLILYGGSASGKSYFVTQKIITEILQGGRNYLAIRKVARTIRNSVFALFVKIINNWGLQKLFKINKSEFSITCINGYKILCQGLDDPEKIKSITVEKGTLTDVWIEEATELSEDDINQLVLRLRGESEHKKRVTMTFNPISETHWLKKRFYDNPGPEITIMKTTYQDNMQHLSPEDIANIEALKTHDPIYYQIYALGEWGQLDNTKAIFILSDLINMFSTKDIENIDYKTGYKVCGADIARMGNDTIRAYLRINNYVIKKLKLKNIDNVSVANELETFIDYDKKTIFNIDAGRGEGVIDTLRHRGYIVNEIPFNGKTKSPRFQNLISELWFDVKNKSKDIKIIFDDKELKDELLSRKYIFDDLKGKTGIEPKEIFKKRFGRSPDNADAFLLTFYQPETAQSDMVFAVDIPDKVVF